MNAQRITVTNQVPREHLVRDPGRRRDGVRPGVPVPHEGNSRTLDAAGTSCDTGTAIHPRVAALLGETGQGADVYFDENGVDAQYVVTGSLDDFRVSVEQ